jgi:hypothetical protein
LHHYSRIHIFVDEQTLSKAPTQIVTRDVSKISITCFGSRCPSSSFDSCPNPASREVDKRFERGDVLGISKLLEASLDFTGGIRISRLAT